MIDDKLHVSRKKRSITGLQNLPFCKAIFKAILHDLEYERGWHKSEFHYEKDAQYLVYDFGNFFFQVKL